jgi:hypothetical protein
MGLTQSGIPVPDGMVTFLDSNTVVSKFNYFEGKCIFYTRQYMQQLSAIHAKKLCKSSVPICH